ncbi:mucin-13-like [Chelmon rostratus]|uniref:mucin-13-like n=1 Tax=Chelmon rostratus TaxID=109905 RepID=UPI001BE8E00C|nr:mucin-13-like [Chelmon rostratus]
MPAAMHLTVLVSLFAVTVCASTTTSSADERVTTRPAQPTSLTVTMKNDVSLSTVTTTKNTQQPTTATHQATASPQPSTSPQILNRTEDKQPSAPPQTSVTNQTSNETVSHGLTLPPGSESPNVTANTTINTTSPDFSHKGQKGDLIENPGLVAVLCIFCIVVALVLVVVTVKCIRSPRSNFERLEDVPMGKVSEESPFAHHSK